MVLLLQTKRLLIYNKKISSSVSKEGIIRESENNKNFIKFLLENKILKSIQKPHFKLNYSSNNYVTFPLNVTIQITDRCNLNCVHCHRNSKNTHDLDFIKFKEVIKELRELNVFNINISGGEPLLVKEIIEVIKWVNKNSLNCTMSTNGTLLNKNLVKKLSEAGLRKVQISLDSSRPEIHDGIRGCCGVFARVVENLILLQNNNINYTFVTTLINQTPDDYGKVIDLAYKLGAKAHKTNTVVPQGFAKINNIPYLNGDTKILKQYIQIWKEKKEKYRGKMELIAETMFSIQLGKEYISLKGIPKILNCGCPAAILTCGINAKGDIIPCPFFSELAVGNIYKNTLREIWKKSKILRELRNREKIEVCQDCALKNTCGGCRARSFGLFHKLFQRDPLCFKFKNNNVIN